MNHIILAKFARVIRQTLVYSGDRLLAAKMVLQTSKQELGLHLTEREEKAFLNLCNTKRQISA